MSDTPDPKEPPNCPRLIFNSDGDSTTYIAFEPPITPEQACRDIEEVAGTAVEVFTNSMGRGDETFSHPTGFGEIYGSNVTEWPQAEGLEYVRWMADSTRALLDQGVNVIELLAARAHERGMQFWPALRMNDIHEDDTARWSALRSTFKKENRHLLIGSPYPKVSGYPGYRQDDFTWAFNFAREEVRERKLGLILETCERYDVDGFEMDFQRGRWYFKQGEEAAGMPLMTDLVRKVRAGTAEIARRKGRPFTLMLRVPPTRERCLGTGLDVPTWIREELADLFIPMDNAYLDMGAEIAAFQRAGRGDLLPDRRRPGALLQGGTATSATTCCTRRPRASGTRGPAASTCSTTTAPGCRRPAAMPTPRTRSSCCARLTTRGGSPAGTSATPSAWTCSSIPPSRGARCPSPSRSGTRARARCSGSSSGTTSNPRGGNRPWPIPGCGSPAGSTTPPWWRHRSPLNGSRLDSGRRIELPSTTTVTWRDVPVVQGENRIWVALDRIEGQDCLRIVGIELVIAYV